MSDETLRNDTQPYLNKLDHYHLNVVGKNINNEYINTKQLFQVHCIPY